MANDTTEVIVQVRDLSHRYARDWAIKGLTFDIPRAGVLGLLGSNGAGKSTFMNILCGVLRQTHGAITINGVDMLTKPMLARRQIGFLPQQAPLYTELTVDEYLRYCARLRGTGTGQLTQTVEAAKTKCGIAHFSKRLIGNLSGGYRQRVGIAQAILHNPKLVVLDEPTSGLDPNQTFAVRHLIKDIAEENSVILSTHILSEVEAICTNILMIELGSIVFSGTLDDFNDEIVPSSLLLAAERLPPFEFLRAIPSVTDVENVTDKIVRLRFEGDRSVSQSLIATGIEKDWGVSEIRFERSSLDEVFAKLSKPTREAENDSRIW